MPNHQYMQQFRIAGNRAHSRCFWWNIPQLDLALMRSDTTSPSGTGAVQQQCALQLCAKVLYSSPSPIAMLYMAHFVRIASAKDSAVIIFVLFFIVRPPVYYSIHG